MNKKLEDIINERISEIEKEESPSGGFDTFGGESSEHEGIYWQGFIKGLNWVKYKLGKKEINKKCPRCFTDLVLEGHDCNAYECSEILVCPNHIIHDREDTLLFTNKFIEKNSIDEKEKEKIFELAMDEKWDSLTKLGIL